MAILPKAIYMFNVILIKRPGNTLELIDTGDDFLQRTQKIQWLQEKGLTNGTIWN
jgi:hypothetical protein